MTTTDTRARVMFSLGFLYLLLLAGLVHRSVESQTTPYEQAVIDGGLVLLWPVFAVEAVAGVRGRGGRPLGPALLRALVVCLLPPYRMGTPDPRTGLLWLPGLGWQAPGKELDNRLDRLFGGPMILIALLTLPVLVLEFAHAERVRSSMELALALHIGVSAIWVAFALEFVLRSSVAPNPLAHARDRWLDLAVVALPLLEFALTHGVDAAPLARLLRLQQALPVERLAGMQQLYRLRGLAGRVFLLLGSLGRIVGDTPARRLRRIEDQIADQEEQLARLRQEAEEVRGRTSPSPGASDPRSAT
jgi:hypothetical protein